MATTQTTYTGNGSTTNFSFTFEYIKESDVKVSIDAVDTSAFTFANATTVSFTSAPAAGKAIRIYRDTDIAILNATFFPGSAIKAEDLNNNFTQTHFATQETDNEVVAAINTSDAAKTIAEGAVTTSNNAVTTANSAQTTSNSAVTTANTASTNASTAVTTADAATVTANNASSSATTAVTTANSAVTTANSAVTTANTAVTTADSAVATANTATTNSNAAISTSNSAQTDATTAIGTANTAATTASSAVTTANSAVTTAGSAVTTANSAVTTAGSAVTTANSAVTTADSAVVTANSAVSTANSAATDASGAVTTSNTASTNASAAVTSANTAVTDSATAITTANSAVATANAATTTANTATTTADSAVVTANTATTTANGAVTTANTAVTTANAAATAVSNAVLFTLIANVAAIPGSPSNNDYVEINDSTGIQSFSPLSGLPSGFVGATGLTVRLRYQTPSTSWVFMSYFANDSETRYLTKNIPVVTGDSTNGSGQITLNCENNSHGIKIKGPPHSAAASYTLTLPNDTGTNGYVLKTDGSGTTSWGETGVTSVEGRSGAVTLAKGDVGLGNVDNTSDANKPVSTAAQTALNAKADLTALNTKADLTALNTKADLTAGKLNTSQLPDIAIAEYKGNVANQTAMLAVTGEKGDWVIRNDDSKVYVITGTNPSVASSWTALSYPAGFSGAYNDLSGKPTIPSNNNQLTNGAGYVTSNTQLSNEQVQDIIGGMVSGNSESGITVTYQDSDGTLDFSVASQTDQNFTNADHTKLNGIETGAKADQTAAEIRTLIKTVDGSGSGIDADSVDGLHAASFLRSDANDSFSGKLTSSARDGGIYGTYDSSKTDHIWSMGTTYKISSTGANFGNLYGLAYKHTTNSTGGTMGGGHQMVWCLNGTPYGAIGQSYVWHSSGMRVGSNDVWHAGNDGTGSGLDADKVDGIQASSFLRSDAADTFSGDLTSSGSARIILKKTDNNVSDHIQFYNGTTRMGEIGCHDSTWLRINQSTNKNIYTPRYMRADGGFFVDGTDKGINGSGNFIGGTIAGASDYSTLLRSNADDTATGTITFNGRVNIRGHLDFADSEYAYFGSSDDWSVYRNANNWTYINDKGNGIIFQDNGTNKVVLEDSGIFRPNSTNTGSIGTSSIKWANVYATTLHGNVNASSINTGTISSDRISKASQAEAEAGTNNTKMMTPLRVAQAINALGGSVIESIQRGVVLAGNYTGQFVVNDKTTTITSVDTSKTMCNFCGTDLGQGRVRLNTSTQIITTGPGNGSQRQLSYEIIEFK